MMNSELTAKIAQAIGKSTEETQQMLDKNPKLKTLLTQMKEEDAQKLMAVLSDKESIAKILATPQARTLMSSMGKKDDK